MTIHFEPERTTPVGTHVSQIWVLFELKSDGHYFNDRPVLRKIIR